METPAKRFCIVIDNRIMLEQMLRHLGLDFILDPYCGEFLTELQDLYGQPERGFDTADVVSVYYDGNDETDLQHFFAEQGRQGLHGPTLRKFFSYAALHWDREPLFARVGADIIKRPIVADLHLCEGHPSLRLMIEEWGALRAEKGAHSRGIGNWLFAPQ